MSNETTTFRVPHPGEFIKEELEAREWTQVDLAYVLDVSPQSLSRILSGRHGITSDMAKALSSAFDVPAEFFINLQTAYDLSVADDPDPSIERRARLQDHYPVREMIKRGWIDENLDSSLLEEHMMRFFKVKKVSEIPYLDHAAKRTSYERRAISPAQIAWLFRVHQIAEHVEIQKYSASKLRKSLETLNGFLRESEESRHAPRILAECGVRLIFVEPLPKAKIDGVCFWINKSSPVIGMSLRYDRIDNFWFVLRHEIEHVLNKDGQEKDSEIMDDIDSLMVDESLPEEELRANEAAQNFCVPKDKLVGFIARKHPYLSENDIVGFASVLGVHPGIVIGQIHDYTRNYKLLRKYLVKVRQFVTSSGTADGWGDVYPVSL